MVSFVQNFSGSQIYNWLMKFEAAVEKKNILVQIIQYGEKLND